MYIGMFVNICLLNLHLLVCKFSANESLSGFCRKSSLIVLAGVVVDTVVAEFCIFCKSCQIPSLQLHAKTSSVEKSI
jgi:hypothetical protein